MSWTISLSCGRDLLHRGGVQEHDIDIAEGVQLAAAIAADGHERDIRQARVHILRLGHRGLEEMAQNDIHQAGALVGDLAAALARVMLQAEAVVFDLEEALVEGEELRGAFLALAGQLLLRVREHFLAMAQDRVRAIA